MNESFTLLTYLRKDGTEIGIRKFVLWNDEVIDTTKQQTYIELEERFIVRRWCLRGYSPI